MPRIFLRVTVSNVEKAKIVSLMSEYRELMFTKYDGVDVVDVTVTSKDDIFTIDLEVYLTNLDKLEWVMRDLHKVLEKTNPPFLTVRSL